jgi:predicted kinase
MDLGLFFNKLLFTNVMNKTLLIIVTGAPGTGKTTLAKKISAELKMPLIVKDEIKEVLFDNIGWDIPGWDPDAWQKALGRGSIEVMHHLGEELLKSQTSHILESNFVSKFANEKFKSLGEIYEFEVVQIYCHMQEDVLLDRFVKRQEQADRHPGHAENTYLEELKEALKTNRFSTLDINGELIDVDTTDFDSIDYVKIIQTISDKLKG